MTLLAVLVGIHDTAVAQSDEPAVPAVTVELDVIGDSARRCLALPDKPELTVDSVLVTTAGIQTAHVNIAPLSDTIAGTTDAIIQVDPKALTERIPADQRSTALRPATPTAPPPPTRTR